MCDDIYYYRDRVRELEATNSFVKSNTLLSIQSRLEHLRDERVNLGLRVDGIAISFGIVRTMLSEK
jgi:hypothetical protein